MFIHGGLSVCRSGEGVLIVVLWVTVWYYIEGVIVGVERVVKIVKVGCRVVVGRVDTKESDFVNLGYMFGRWCRWTYVSDGG